ncbi:signal pepetide [Acinetobacter sp. V2]|nr:signal pepetide [Acinetobacter sp. V2]
MTHNALLLKTIMTFILITLLVLSIILWKQTPDLFEYFNQAFCPH